jgi:uncharacterized protein (DUF305 family)
MTRILPALALALTLPTAVLAGSHMDHSGHGAATEATASTAAYEAASARMHENMAIVLTGDADVDFARGMIPHHQGAIDMATIVLEHGDDPQIRALAEEIIAAQQGEIAVLQAWLAENAQ